MAQQAARRAFGRGQQTTGSSPGAANADGGARQLLRAGLWTCAVGIVAVLLIKTVFGGIGVHGPHTNSGWLALITALMCLPFGLMLTVLGLAKWLRNRRMAEARLAERNR